MPSATTSRAALSASIDLIAPALPPVLVTADALSRIRRVAAQLPAVHRAGFECRLDASDARVDVQQGIIPSTWEPGAVAAFATRLAAESRGAPQDAWTRVARFCAAWLDARESLRTHVSELWLELDVEDDATDDTTPRPSLFATLPRTTADPTGANAATDVARWLMDARDSAAVAPFIARLASGIANDGGRVSHVGVMLGRSPAGIRVHASGVRYRRFGSLLDALGWRGDVDAVLASAHLLFDHADEVVLCLDVAALPTGTMLLPRLGVEAFFAQTRGVDPRWPTLLHALTERGLASAAKGDALLRWPGHHTPLDAGAAWPDDLIMRALVAPSSALGTIERRLSHVKLFHDLEGATTAKAYFGYGHLWRDSTSTPNAEPAIAVSTARPAASRTLDDAIDGAETFLLRARNQAGWWRDFYDLGRSAIAGERVAGYASDEWVTAFVGTMLASAPSARARDAARDAWALLERRRDAQSGWGYHAQLPADADSTTWALRLARAVGAPTDARMTAAEAFVRAQTLGDGGVMCYRREDCAQIAGFLRMAGPYDGWCASHACITAAVAALALSSSHRGFLRRTQRADGRWAGHWWDDDEYATACATSVLATDGASGSADAAARGARWAAARVAEDGAVTSAAHGDASAFATALAITAMVAAPVQDVRDSLARASGWLRASQRADGSFAPSSRLRVPAPYALDPLADPSSTLTYLDRDATFTTATALAALVDARRVLGA